MPVALPQLEVSENRRFLQEANGAPFFYLADTAWCLFQRLTLEETETYLQDRAAKGFNVIQMVALGELDAQNRAGDAPFENNDPTKPVEAYWRHVDEVVKRTNELGMYAGLLPTWGDRWNKGAGTGPEIFTPDNARIYGKWLGKRYADAGIIWILGGDRAVETDTHRQIIFNMAEGLRDGDGGAHLRTFHPNGSTSSSAYFPNEPWLDFHMIQSGHCMNSLESFRYVSRDYELQPTKPTIDAEPCYEDHPRMNPDWTPAADGTYYGAREVRRAAYWAVFSGGCGQTYGAHPIWMMWDHGRPVVNKVRRSWREALGLPGSSQIRYLRELMLSLPYFSRIPATAEVVAAQPPEALDHIAATRDRDADGRATFVAIYFPRPLATTLNLSCLRDPGQVEATWFDPRTGQRSSCRLPIGPKIEIQPQHFPADLEDAVLLIVRK